jgi:hypothetical protein
MAPMKNTATLSDAEATAGGDLADDDLITLWETGRRLSPPEKALLLLTHGQDGGKQAVIRRWPIGRRDRALIQLFTATFGAVDSALSTCPDCQQSVAFPIDFQTMATGPVQDQGRLRFNHAGVGYPFRLPNSDDLLAITSEADEARALQLLASNCISSSPGDAGQEADNGKRWSDGALKALAAAIEAHDPYAEIRLALACPECGGQWQEPLDIVDYFWRVLTQEAQTLLAQVDLLARAYGWSQEEILNLGASRRALYVEMILS